MTAQQFVSPNEIRARFSHAMSDMYQKEVPLYGDLLELVAETNRQVLREDAALAHQLQITGEIERPPWSATAQSGSALQASWPPCAACSG